MHHGTSRGPARSHSRSYILHSWTQGYPRGLLLPSDLCCHARHHPGVPAGQSQ